METSNVARCECEGKGQCEHGCSWPIGCPDSVDSCPAAASDGAAPTPDMGQTSLEPATALPDEIAQGEFPAECEYTPDDDLDWRARVLAAEAEVTAQDREVMVAEEAVEAAKATLKLAEKDREAAVQYLRDVICRRDREAVAAKVAAEREKREPLLPFETAKGEGGAGKTVTLTLVPPDGGESADANDGQAHVDQPADDSWRETPVDMLDIKPTVIEKLRAGGIKTIGDIADWTAKPGEFGHERRITDIKGIGVETAGKIDAALDEFWANWRAQHGT